MSLRPSRLQALASPERRVATPTAAERPQAVPAVKPAKPRDPDLQDRLRRIAAARTEKLAAADAVECKRAGRRKKTALPGLLTFKTMRMQVPCTVTDMSGTGARLSLPQATATAFGDLEHIPDRLTLVLRADRMQVDCEIKWRRAGSLGVRFLGPPMPLPKS